MRSLRLRPAESPQVRARAPPLRLSDALAGLMSHRHPPPPNNSFKPTPCRGVGRVLYATLARVRRPATGRLNSGVRAQGERTMNEILITLTIVLFFAGILAFLLVSILNDAFAVKYSRTFKENLKKAISSRQLTAQQIAMLAEAGNLDTHQTSHAAKQVLADLLIDSESKPEHITQVETYLSYMKSIEPFEGVPSELRIHLERLKDQTPSVGPLLDPLAMQIKELASVRNRETKLQKYYTAGGFFVGIAGIALAIWMYTNPQAPEPATQLQKAPATSTDKSGAEP